ncbi:unnamed protein product [Parascedosporium putredinis]|uniref:Uncharacterized protein n=1 Tax=Parascedosporium putredinis TaxID=1442378 RepID=A0A9P1HBY7_9PEZI|nr:unnamed protein product [Parascedosporium putredinis]CAI8004224.1 unnamed protein product [Parascedosporium putredinis]
MATITITRVLTLLLALLPFLATAQNEGYVGYRLDQEGDPEAAPDVYLNASVHVKEISVEVDNITAKVNLDARVLNLLHFSAGVDASIDRVKLLIQDVVARVELEARLENVVGMVDDVLRSIDLNPIVATLGQNVRDIVDDAVGVITDPVEGGSGGGGTGDDASSGAEKRDLRYNLEYNILYSINDYSGKAHTNRVLAQNGDLVDIKLDNEGRETGRSVAGTFARLMEFTGHNKTISVDDEVTEYEMQYVYKPFPSIEVFAWVYMNTAGAITRTEVIAGATGAA